MRKLKNEQISNPIASGLENEQISNSIKPDEILLTITRHLDERNELFPKMILPRGKIC